jgi:hypothetical protein
LFVALLVVLAIVWWIWPNGGDEPVQPAAEPTSTPSVSVTPSESVSASPKPSKTKTVELLPPCEDSAISVTVATDADTYPADRQPSFTFTVENISDQGCSRDVGQAANELRVTSGGTQVWSSDDCNPGGEKDPTNLDPGDRFVQTVAWPEVQSAPGCPTPQEAASIGTYQVVARNLEVLSEPAVFVLE